MSRREGTLKLSSNIEPNVAAPLDARSIVPTLADLTANGTFPYHYVGMMVTVQATGTAYILTGDDPTVAANWKENGSGSSSAADIDYDNTTSGLDATKVQGAIDELEDEKADKATSISGYGITDAYTKQEVNNEIDKAVVSAYKAGGAKTCAQLTSALLIADNEGLVYNMSDTGTTTSDFIEGPGVEIGEGSDVAVIKVGNDYKFNLLPGIIDISGKADKVANATNNNFAALDANGNLKDSGSKASDFATSQDMSGKADKVTSATSGNFAGLDENGNLTDSGSKASDFLTQHQDISGKADKVSSATENNFAGLDANGNLKDSGSKASDFLTQHQDISGKADKVSGGTADNFAALDSNGNLKDSGNKASDFLTQHQDISGKADKVSNATADNFASLDANGNLKDSGNKASDFLTQHQDISGKADKVSNATANNFAGLDANGNITDSGSKASDFLTEHQDISGKADKVSGATADNFAGLDANGNLKDSGSKASDFLTQHQDISGKADKVSSATEGDFAGLDANGNLTDSGKKAADFAAAQALSDLEQALSDLSKEVPNNDAYIFRQGKGNMVDLAIVGGSLAWNQQVVNGNFASSSGWQADATSIETISIANNALTMTVVASANQIGVKSNNLDRTKQKVGHKYFVSAMAKSAKAIRISLDVLGSIRTTATSSANEKVNCASIFEYSSAMPSTGGFSVRVYAQTVSGNFAVNDTVAVENYMVIDLTQMFGPTIADYIYSLEQATTGAGVAWFRKYFSNSYYDYVAESIESVNVASRKVVGFNLWNEEWEVGSIGSDGSKVTTSSGRIRSKNLIPISSGNYYLSANIAMYATYDSNGDFLRYVFSILGGVITINAGERYIMFATIPNYGTVYSNDICINISKTTGSPKNGDYEPYKEISYDFDSSKTLRGVPQLVGNKLSYDGDIYKADGSVTRKYGIVTFDGSSDETWNISGSDADAYFYIPITGMTRRSYQNLVNNQFNCIQSGEERATENTIWGVFSQIHVHASTSIAPSGVTSDGLAEFKTWLSTHNLVVVYLLATPTTETAEPYQNPQRAFIDGTEEFIDAGVEATTRDVAIPVGNNSVYYINDTLPFIEDYVDGAVNDKVDWNSNSKLGTHNLFPIKLSDIKATYSSGTWSGNSLTRNGVTFTFITDGDYVTEIRTSGTASSSGCDLFILNGVPDFLEDGVDYILSGCPSGGSDSTYLIQYNNWGEGSAYIKYDYGEGVAIQKITDSTLQKIRVWIKDNVNATGLVFKPMIRLATDINPEYEPYSQTNKQLTQNKIGWDDNAIIGAHNIMPYDINKIKATHTGGGSWNNNTFTFNSGVIVQLNNDGSVTVSTVAGGASENTGFVFFNQSACIEMFKKYKGKAITFAGGKKDVEFGAQGLDGTGIGYYSNNNEVTINVASDIDTNPQSSLAVKILVRQGKVITSPVTIYPWFKIPGDNNSDFTPYAKTNRQLTEDIEPLLVSHLPSTADLNNYISEGSYWYNATDSTTMSHIPQINEGGHLDVKVTQSGNVERVAQIIYANSAKPKTYMRNNYGGSWTDWYSSQPSDTLIVVTSDDADVTVASDTHVYERNGFVSGTIHLEIPSGYGTNAYATLGSAPQYDTYVLAIAKGTDTWTLPMVIYSNGQIDAYDALLVYENATDIFIPVNYFARS